MDKYIIYKNDLFNRNTKSIDFTDSNLIYYNKEVEELVKNKINMDTIEYRLQECKKNDYYYLDFSNMNLSQIEIKYKNITCLFISNNNLDIFPDLSSLTNLKVLDISDNKIKRIYNIPSSVTELNCNNNSLKYICDLDIEIFDCNNNKLEILPKMNNIKKLSCSNNRLKEIPEYKNITEIICNNNEIIKIYSNTMKYLDCSNNKIEKLQDMPNLTDLFCSNNPIKYLPEMNNLLYLEIQDTLIMSISFFSKLEKLICSYNKDIMLSDKYINKSIRVHKDKIIIIEFKLD